VIGVIRARSLPLRHKETLRVYIYIGEKGGKMGMEEK